MNKRCLQHSYIENRKSIRNKVRVKNKFIAELENFINTPFLNSLFSIDNNINKILIFTLPICITAIIYLITNQYMNRYYPKINILNIGLNNIITFYSIVFSIFFILYIFPILTSYLALKKIIKISLKNINNFNAINIFYTSIFTIGCLILMIFNSTNTSIDYIKTILNVFFIMNYMFIIMYSGIIFIKKDVGKHAWILIYLSLIIGCVIISYINFILSNLWLSTIIIISLVLLFYIINKFFRIKNNYLKNKYYSIKNEKIFTKTKYIFTIIFKEVNSTFKIGSIITQIVFIFSFVLLINFNFNQVIEDILTEFNIIESTNNIHIYSINKEYFKKNYIDNKFTPNNGHHYKGYLKWKLGTTFIFCKSYKFNKNYFLSNPSLSNRLYSLRKKAPPYKLDKKYTTSLIDLADVFMKNQSHCIALPPSAISLWSN